MSDRKISRGTRKKKVTIVEPPKSNSLNRKQQLLKKAAEQRILFENLTIKWQEKLYDPVDLTVLQESVC